MSDLVERLRAQAQRASDIARRMAEDKSLRQEGNAEGRTDLYMWPEPEQTTEGKAADRIEALESLLCEAREVIRKTGGGDTILNEIDTTLNRSHGADNG